MKSMTGFGRAVKESELATITVEVKSVNSKALKVRASLPRLFNRFSVEVQKAVSEVVKRGDVDLFVKFTPTEKFTPPITVNYSIAEKVIEAAKRAGAVTGTEIGVSLRDLLAFPEVFQKEEEDPEPLKPQLFEAVGEALRELDASRKAEGEKLKEFFLRKIETIEELVGRVEEKAQGINKLLFERLKEKVKKLLEGEELPEEFTKRVELEVALIAEKQDVTEEISRLKLHCRRFRELLESEEPVGKTLDFLCQEMHREANTLGSKLKEVDATDEVIAIKSEIARIKEQVQNVE